MHEQVLRDSGLAFMDLLDDPDAWSPWAPRTGVEPRFAVEADGGPGGRPSLVLSGGGNPHACGCWRFPLSGLKDGRTYRIEAVFKTEDMAAPARGIRAILTSSRGGDTSERFYDHLDYQGVRDGWHLLSLVLAKSESVPELRLNLFLAWSAEGWVRWGDVRLYDVTAAPVSARSVHLAVVSGSPSKPQSPAACIDFYADRLDEAASERVDLICLPELINIAGLSKDSTDLAEPIPGPTSDRLSESARTHGIYIAASMLERQGEAVYNTGLLIDRAGGVLGKYRKTHLTLDEGLLRGTAPGDDYPVFRTDFGTVGYMICYDAHYPEVPRLLALKGADVILFSNNGDSREGGSLWEPFMRTRAIDNQVHIAAAVNSGRSCIVSPKGEFLAMADRTRGAVVTARCDLNDSLYDFSGRPIHRRYDQIRRTDTFADLLRPIWGA